MGGKSVSGEGDGEAMREVLTESGGVVLLTELERDCVEGGRGISVMGRGPKGITFCIIEMLQMYEGVSGHTYFQCDKW